MFYITIVSRIVNQKRSEEVLESWITWFSAWDIRTFFLSCWLPAWQFMKHLLEQSHKRFAHLTYFVSSLYLFFLSKLTYKGKESKETIFGSSLLFQDIMATYIETMNASFLILRLCSLNLSVTNSPFLKFV